MEPPILAEFMVGGEAEGWRGEFEQAEGLPEIFSEGGGDGLLAQEGQLFEGKVVLKKGRVSKEIGWGRTMWKPDELSRFL